MEKELKNGSVLRICAIAFVVIEAINISPFLISNCNYSALLSHRHASKLSYLRLLANRHMKENTKYSHCEQAPMRNFDSLSHG